MAEAAATGDLSRLRLRSAGEILRQSLSSSFCSSSFPSLLLASLLLLSFRSALFSGTLRLSSLSDHDPSIRRLLSNLSPDSPPPHPRRSPPLLSLSRLSSLDDDTDTFFSPSPPSPPIPNSSFLLFIHSAPDPYKITIPRSHSAPFFFSFNPAETESQNPNHRSLPKSLELDRTDLASIIYLVTLLSFCHSLAILAFVIAYSSALGVVFFSITVSYLQKPISPLESFFYGSSLGLRRLIGFVFLRWAIKDALVQFLSIWFFSEVQDQVQLFKLFLTAKLMPFSPLLPINPLGPHDSASLSGFFLAWAFLDSVLSILFTAVPWVVITDRNVRRAGRDVIKEGCYLFSLLPSQAVLIKWWETLLCGSVGRTLMVMICGRVIGGLIYCLSEVYFMVVWLNFYFGARYRDAEMEGRNFEIQDLEESLNGARVR